MTLQRDDLERAFTRFHMPEPALDRLLDRRRRREHRRRIGAAVTAAAVMLGAASFLLRSHAANVVPATHGQAPVVSCADGTWSAPVPAGLSGQIFETVATSSKDVYAVVQPVDTPGVRSDLFHFGPTGSTRVDDPATTIFAIASLPAISGETPSPLWLLGDNTVSVWNDDRWASLPPPPLRASEVGASLDVAAANSVWISAVAHGGSRILTFDGSTWSESASLDWAVASIAAITPDDVWVGGRTLGVSGNPMSAHWDGARWTDVAVPGPSDAGITNLAATPDGDVWGTLGTALSGGHPTTHVLHVVDGGWTDTTTLEGDPYLFHQIAAGSSGVWWYDWAQAPGRQSIKHWTGSNWERSTTPNGDLGGNELWQSGRVAVTDAGAVVVRMGDDGLVAFRYTC